MNKVDKIADLLVGQDQEILRRMWNFYQAHTASPLVIYHTADSFSEVMKDYSPLELAGIIRESIRKGTFDDQLDYFEITRAGFLHSFDLLCFSDYFCYEELAEYIISANDDMGNRDIRKILNEPEISKNEVIKNLCEKMPHELVDEWNDYQKKINSHKIIMSMEDDFNSVLKDFTPYELASLIGGSTQMMYFNPNSVYFYYDSIQNKLYSFDDPGDIYFFSLEELAKHIVTTAE